MSRAALLKWRESASLIIAAKNKFNKAANCDYRVLLIGRPGQGSFASSSVFPGGVCEPADESAQWLHYFQNVGVSNEKLQGLVHAKEPRANIFLPSSGGCLQREISLRITALRETFEEVGLLLCRDKHALSTAVDPQTLEKKFDRVHWQRLVHDDATQFLKLCNELQVVPDLWSLHDWSIWMTPAALPQRFTTAFYLVTLNDTPSLHLEAQEVPNSTWETPRDYIDAAIQTKILMYPPQYYELSRLSKVSELEALELFARQRAEQYGTLLLLPILYQCLDGRVFLLPGDGFYPKEPFLIDGGIKIDMTMEEFRGHAKRLHRTEWKSLHEMRLFLNSPLADGQISPQTSSSPKL